MNSFSGSSITLTQIQQTLVATWKEAKSWCPVDQSPLDFYRGMVDKVLEIVEMLRQDSCEQFTLFEINNLYNPELVLGYKLSDVLPVAKPETVSSDQVPSVGRIVHYYSYGTPGGEFLPEARAAIITQVIYDSPDCDNVRSIGLCVLNPTGIFLNQAVRFSEVPKPGHWSWPSRF